VPEVILPQNDEHVEVLLKESEMVRNNFRKLQEDFDEINDLLDRCKRLAGLPATVSRREVRVKVHPIRSRVDG